MCTASTVTPYSGGITAEITLTSPQRRPGRTAARRPPLAAAGVVMVVATVLGLVLRLYQLTGPGFLLGVTEHDDGVYFGSAVRLVHGVVPYGDFVLVQPPGIAVLLAPLAWLARATGTGSALAVARVLTACAGAAAVPLAGLRVRGKGLLATSLTCGVLAVYSAGINAAHTVLLEPWVVLLCLLGMLAIFDGDQLAARPRRLAWGGAAFGLAAAIKLWALLPVVVLLAVGGRRVRGRAARAYLGGFATAFGLLLASAPG
ncbi:MAG TPA: glycosyltransferase 87 family protein [Solirubrobacteraceae bacterium]|nr:glycosyltransferase 87 family protein [Solirubrobacteraceae bacterium]